MLGDERVSHFAFRAEYAVAFFRMSRSSITLVSSRFNLLISASLAKTALMDLTVGGPVSCTLSQTEQTIPPIALSKAGGYDLSKGMAHTGWALAWPRRERFTRELNDMRARKFMGSGRDALLRRGIGVGARGNKIWGQESQNNVVRHGR
jgi:hypothetical protein